MSNNWTNKSEFQNLRIACYYEGDRKVRFFFWYRHKYVFYVSFVTFLLK